jgi:hypothetical protein
MLGLRLMRHCGSCPADIIAQLRKIYDEATYAAMKEGIARALEEADRKRPAPHEAANGGSHVKRQRSNPPETITFEP